MNRVNDFLRWFNAIKNSSEKKLKEAESKSENTFYLQDVVDDYYGVYG